MTDSADVKTGGSAEEERLRRSSRVCLDTAPGIEFSPVDHLLRLQQQQQLSRLESDDQPGRKKSCAGPEVELMTATLSFRAQPGICGMQLRGSD